MKLTYVANIRLPTEKAHGVQIMKTCEAFVQAGLEVELVVTDRSTPIVEDPFVYYGVRTPFKIVRLPVVDTVSWGRVGFTIEALDFARKVQRYLHTHPSDIVYGRDELVLARISVAAKIVWETHTGAWNTSARKLIHRAFRVVAISQGLKDFYLTRGVPSAQVIVAHDGVDLDAFAHAESKAEARARLKLPQDKQVALYIGRLDGWKGSTTLMRSAELLPGEVLLAVIGGEPRQIERLSKEHPQVSFLGPRPYRELPDNEAAADVLVLPNTGMQEISAKFTSPLKLFSYMAAGIPIVVSDLPSIREVLDDTTCYFVRPDDPSALAAGISRALSDGEASAKAHVASARVARYTWSQRGASILANLQS